MLSAAYLRACFMVAGVGAWYLLRRKHLDFARRSVALGTAFATVLIAGQVFLGDILYGTMIKYQPSKMQAAEGFWEKESQSPDPYYWFIIPDQKNQQNRFALGMPYLGSIRLTHTLEGRVQALKNTPRDRQPIMGMVFYAFRTMYGLAIIMFVMGVASLWLRFQGRLFTSRWFLWMLVFMTPSGIIATLAGWYLAETGRQPWVIYGILRTADAGAPVHAQALVSTLIAFVCVYAVFLGAFLIFTVRIIRRAPSEAPSYAEASASLKTAFRPHVLDNMSRAIESVPAQRS